MASLASRLPNPQPPVFKLKPVTAPCVFQHCGSQVYPPPILPVPLKPARCYLSPMPEFAHQVQCPSCELAMTAIYHWPNELPLRHRHKVLRGAALDAYVAMQHAGADPTTFARIFYSRIAREHSYARETIVRACKRLEDAGYVECRREGLKRWYRVLIGQRPKGE